MSFFPVEPIDKTIGTAYEAFHYNVPSGMLPQQAYKPRAAGPATLTGVAPMQGLGRVYQYDLRSSPPANLRGFGDVDVLSPAVNYLMQTAGVQQALASIVTIMWPQIQANMDESLKPIKYIAGATAAAAVGAAIFSYLIWEKS